MVQFPPEKTTAADLNDGDLGAWTDLQYALARTDFYLYRRIIRPNLVTTWWQQHLAQNLMWFFRQMKEGRRPTMVIQAPPQHGKTEQITDFISWVAGLDPDLRTIFGSYSDELGVKVNLALQRIYDSPRYKQVFSSPS